MNSQINTLLDFRSRNVLAIYFVFVFCISFLFLVAPGATFNTYWMNDSIALFDAAYRVSSGQIPHVDFSTSIGAINFFLTSVGISLGLRTGVTIALGGVLALFLVLLPGLYMMSRRFPLLITLILCTYVWLLIVVPLGVGENFDRITWAMYYNRHSWAAIFFIFIFYIPPQYPRQENFYLDGLALGLLVIFALYCKITYGCVAIAFVLANMFVSRYNRAVSYIALTLIAITVLLLELTLGLMSAYFDAVSSAVAGRSLYRSGFWHTGLRILENASLLTAAFSCWLLCVVSGRRHILDLIFVVGCISISIVLLDQNGGSGYPVAVFAIFACMFELARRNANKLELDQESSPVIPLAIMLMTISFLALPTLNRVLAWTDHFDESVKNRNISGIPESLSSIRVPLEDRLSHVIPLMGAGDLTPVQVDSVRREFREILTASEYFATITDGVELLSGVAEENDRTFTMDTSNPFSFALDLQPSRIGFPFLYGRPPKVDVVLRDITIIMEPRVPYNIEVSEGFKTDYREYMRRNFVLSQTSEYWHLWVRRSI